MQVLQAVVPGSADSFIRDELLKPMAISNYFWQEDLSGYPKSAAGSSFLSRDMLKMGLLTLNKGKWKGKQHLPAKFVEQATSALTHSYGDNSYGYFWWSQNQEIEGKKYPVVQGRGAGGQFIFMFPTLDLVVVATAHNKGMGTMLKELPPRLVPAFAQTK
jgi:CubicO group peptidase (beta-lactamase class C family)